MGSPGQLTSYEELRQKNVERNEQMMRTLGLLAPRFQVTQEVAARGNNRSPASVTRNQGLLRRSARIACSPKTDLTSTIFVETAYTVDATGGGDIEIKGEELLSNQKLEGLSESIHAEDSLCTKKMDDRKIMEDLYSTEGSSDSADAMEVNKVEDCNKIVPEDFFGSDSLKENLATTSSSSPLNSANALNASTFGTNLQELVMRALMQCTASLIGPAAGVLAFHEGEPIAMSSLAPGVSCPQRTWDEAAYNKAQARRTRKTSMQRTSAGEDSDSQADFPVPTNESPQQKSLRNRRLNRFRDRRAKELTNNRKAMKKVPYVLHVDGTGKAKGIHRRQWRSAVRGQCGRLDPTMDNINHHPKHVVDSIWHALQKEWEFEGFAHRAREMFEKSATKFMRNRKMQLKYKSLKKDGVSKPGDVKPTHWAKIVDLTKTSSKQDLPTCSTQISGKGKGKIEETVEKVNESMMISQSACLKGKQSSISTERDLKFANDGLSDAKFVMPVHTACQSVVCDSVEVLEEDVDARIRSLQSELLRLENSRKYGHSMEEDVGRVCLINRGRVGVPGQLRSVIDGMKENVMPQNVSSHVLPEASARVRERRKEDRMEDKALSSIMETNLSSFQLSPGEDRVHKIQPNFNDKEMECGEVVTIFTCSGEGREEIGKGIVMGLAGSKFGKKVIPKGWRSIKVSSSTSTGASELCPFPAGWKDNIKHKTLCEVEGRLIVWPDSSLSI